MLRQVIYIKNKYASFKLDLNLYKTYKFVHETFISMKEFLLPHHDLFPYIICRITYYDS